MEFTKDNVAHFASDDVKAAVIDVLFRVHEDVTGHKPHPDSAQFYVELVDAAELHARKQLDYGADNDPFSNVRASEDWGIPGWVGCMVRANDKIKRLQTFATKGELANESAEDAFRDLAVYAIIGLILFQQQT